MIYFIVILFFLNTSAYYLACNSKDCITNTDIYELHDIIKQKHYTCYNNYTINNREHYMLCYDKIISFSGITYNIKKCDYHNYDNYDEKIYKPISNDPSNCTISPIPILNNDIKLDNSMIKSDIIVKLYKINETSKNSIRINLQNDAFNKKAYAIIEYNENILKIPEEKCKHKRYGKVLRKKCKWYDIEHLQISYRLVLLI